jgi:hypothetical protein
VSLDDAAIDARGKAKVIGIDDQPAHRVSLAGRALTFWSAEAAQAGLTGFSHVAYTHSSAIRAVPLKRVPNGTALVLSPAEGI